MMTPVIARARLTKKRLQNQAGSRGVTLFEVLIVVAILSMVAGGVAMFALPQFSKAQVSTAQSGCRTIRQAVQTWQATMTETSCPTVSQLVEDKILDRGTNTNDPWNNAYVISCADQEVTVMSFGPDKKKGTTDDIAVPAKTGAAQ